MGIRRKNLKKALIHMAADSLALLLAVSPFLHIRAEDAPTYSSSLSVWVKGHYENEDIYGIGMQLSLYQIASAEVDEKNLTISYTLLEKFKETEIDLSDVSRTGIDTTFVEQLKKHIAEKQITGNVILTEKENQGRADFTNLAPGFYLVVQTGADEDYSKQYQDMDAFCISIPLIYKDASRGNYLEYNVTVCPKLQTLPVEYKAAWEWYGGVWTLRLYSRYRISPSVTTEWEAVEDIRELENAEDILNDVWDGMGPGGWSLSEEEVYWLIRNVASDGAGWNLVLWDSTGGSGGNSGGSDSALEEEASAGGNDVSMNLPDDWLSGDTTENTGKGLPQTGLEVIRIYVLGGGGLLLILTGIAVLRGDSDRGVGKIIRKKNKGLG